MDEWKSRIEKLYGPLGRDGRRRNEVMAKIANMPIEPSRTLRGLIMRIAIPSGIAAGLMLAVGLSIMLVSDHRVSAAQGLQQVAEVNKAYKGWIHIEVTARLAPGSTLPATMMPVPTAARQHINTDDGTLANVVEFEGKKRIELYVPARKEAVKYDSATGEVRIVTMMADSARSMAENLATSPVTIAGAIAEFKKSTGRDPEEVVRKRESGADRYDVTLFKSEQDAQRICQERGICLLFSRITLWADPQTDLIQKVQYVQQGLHLSASFTYGNPEIRDIYDLGAPRDAKVIDNRLATDLSAVLDRLDARAVKGLGNCVAVITITDVVDANGTPNRSAGYAHLCGKDTDRWFVGHYRIGNPTGRAAEGTFLPTAPAGWPVPDLKQLVGALKDVPPTEYWLMGKERGWAGWARSGVLSKSYDTRVIAPKERAVMLASVGLGYEIWPSRYKGLGGDDAKVELVSDSNRPGLLGLHCERVVATDGQKERQEHLIWVDPARDDMPSETTWRVYQGDRLTTEVATKYLEFAQLPSGQWYPRRWHEARLQSVPGRATTQPNKSVQEYNLLVVPDMRLDNDWFVNPAEKFAQKK